MFGGKRFKTLREAKTYLKRRQEMFYSSESIYNLHGKVYKYYVGTRLQWLNY
jgi:hypothetical protein